jgi:hypothetical protein
MKHIKLFEEFEWGAGDKDGSMPSLLPVDSEFISFDMIKELGLKLKKAFTEKGFKIIEPYNGGAKKPAQGKKEISISVAEDHYNQFYNLHSNIQQYSVVKLKANTDHEKMPTYEKILLTANEENKDEVMSILKDNIDNNVKVQEDQWKQHNAKQWFDVSLYLDMSKI